MTLKKYQLDISTALRTVESFIVTKKSWQRKCFSQYCLICQKRVCDENRRLRHLIFRFNFDEEIITFVPSEGAAVWPKRWICQHVIYEIHNQQCFFYSEDNCTFSFDTFGACTFMCLSKLHFLFDSKRMGCFWVLGDSFFTLLARYCFMWL